MPQINVTLVDGHALAYRSYHALPPLTNSRGETVHALIGFLRVLIKLARTAGPMVVAFDPKGGTFRHERSDTYKAGRTSAPDDFRVQLREIQHLTRLTGLPVVQTPGVEADDMIATLTHQAVVSGLTVTIVTSDKDSFQLLGDEVSVLNGDTRITPATVLERYGVTPEQWVDYRALTGDASDNLPGARGIGPKTAARLLQSYGTLDGIYQAVQDGTLTGRTAELLRVSQEDVRFTHEMSTLRRDTDTHADLFAPRVPSPDLAAEARRVELGTVTEDLLRAFAPDHTSGQSEAQPGQATAQPSEQEILASDQEASPAVPVPAPDLQPVPWPPAPGGFWGVTYAQPDDLSALITGAAMVSGSTLSVAPTEEHPEYLALTAPHDLFGQTARIKPAALARLRLAHPQSVPPGTVQQALGPAGLVHAVGAKHLTAYLNIHGLRAQVGEDPMLHAHLLNQETVNPEKAAQAYLNRAWPADAAGQAVAAEQLARVLREQHRLDPLRQRLLDDIERPLSSVLAEMEASGVALDTSYLAGLSDAVNRRISSLEETAYDLAGHEFSINSKKQLETVLYDELGLPSGKKTKTGRSVAVEALEPLVELHPIIRPILEYRELEKLRGTYLEPLPKMLHPLTGRLHTTFTQTNTATGRLSSLRPNLQNIPVRSTVGREIRRGFVAAPGFALVSADYSQIELRLLAHIAEDPALRQAFIDGADIHRRTGAQMLGIPEDQVDADTRRAAKTINFGVLYGMGARRLANELGLPYAEAKRFIDRYFAAYPGIRRYIDRTLDQARRLGYVETLYGRRRYVTGLDETNQHVREQAERYAYNMPIQGTAADIIKIAMINLHPQLRPLGARLLLQVHDELLIETPEEHAEETLALTRRVMESAATLSVPLTVEGGTGPTWYDSK